MTAISKPFESEPRSNNNNTVNATANHSKDFIKASYNVVLIDDRLHSVPDQLASVTSITSSDEHWISSDIPPNNSFKGYRNIKSISTSSNVYSASNNVSVSSNVDYIALGPRSIVRSCPRAIEQSFIERSFGTVSPISLHFYQADSLAQTFKTTPTKCGKVFFNFNFA